MESITKSASKIVLLLVVIALVILALVAGILGVVRGSLDPKEILTLFGTALSFVMGFYFGSKPTNGDPENLGGK